jgi:protein-disulfide isomerase
VIVGILLSCLLLGGVASARVELGARQVITLEAAPLASASSANGQTVVVLMDNGRANIYNNGGKLRGSVDVGVKSAGSDIAVSPDGGVLYVTDGRDKTLKMIALDYIAQLRIGNAPVLGPKDAPVTIVEFSDFQCPYCSKLNPVLQEVVAKYPEKVKLVFKFFPLPFHKMAMPASKASLAAGKQQKFWEYRNELMISYKELSEQKLVEIAKKLGLDMNRFTRDCQDPRWVNVIRDDMQEAAKNQVRGTPTIFVNGRRMRSRTPEAFDQAIKRALH